MTYTESKDGQVVLTVEEFLKDVLKNLDAVGIRFDAELAEEGSGWEVAAEPEPQYFETLRDAVLFFASLRDLAS